MSGLLVIVPCGQAKIWNREPDHGPAQARDAYTGGPFKVHRRYAEKFGDRWLVLSAKYGLISPDFLIPGPYNVTFKRVSTGPVSPPALRHQVIGLDLEGIDGIIGLGGADYRSQIEQAFQGTSPSRQYPFAGLPIGKMMQATKRAIERGSPYPEERGWLSAGVSARMIRPITEGTQPPNSGGPIEHFDGTPYGYLSNFFPWEVTYGGLTYQSTEAAFQAQKTLDEEARGAFTTLTPKQAKERGRKVALRSDWEVAKDGIMLDLLRLKFAQAELRVRLLATGDRGLIEGNNWGDRMWGMVRDPSGRWQGQNKLGKLLMQVRDELRGSAGQAAEE